MSVTRLNVINSDSSTLELNNISNENITLAQGGGDTDIGQISPLNISSSGALTINNISDASGIGTGSLINLGGFSVSKKLYTGTDVALATVSGTTTIGSVTPITISSAGILRIDNETDSTSSTNGALIVDGGIAIAKKMYTGTDTFLSTVSGTTTIGSTNPVTVSSNGIISLPSLTASQAVFTDSSKNLVSIDTVGTGLVVLQDNPIIHDSFLQTNGQSDVGGSIVTFRNSDADTLFTVVDETSLGSFPSGFSTSLAFGLGIYSSGSGPINFYTTSGKTLRASISNAGIVSFTNTTASTSSTTGSVTLAGGISINNSTDATSEVNGGTITTLGGAGIAKKLYVGTDTVLAKLSGTVTMGSTTPVTVSALGAVTVNNATDTSNLSTGSLITLGGHAVAKKLYTGTDTFLSTVSGITTIGSSTQLTISASGALNVVNTTDATSSIAGGAATISGGLAVTKKLYIGTDVFLASVSGSVTIGSSTPATVSASGEFTVNNVTDASGISTGSAIFLGGISITKKLYTGDSVFLASNSGTTTIGSTNALTITADGILNANNTSASISGISGGAVFQGGISINNSTEASSSSNGGSFTTNGGIAVAKKAFIGGNVSLANGLDMNNTAITNVLDPVNDGDATNKAYVDSVAQGLDIKDSVKAATTVPGTLASSFENGDVIDDITLVTGDRILIKNQTSAIENGIYIVQATGTPLRSADFATGTTQSGSFVFVESGTNNGSTGWVVTNNPGNDIVDTDPISFSQFSGAGQIIAGTGLTKSVNTLSVNSSLTHVTAVGTLTSLTVSPGVISGVTLNLSGLTASSPVFTDGSKNLVSVTSTGTGTTVVLQNSPTLITPVLGVASGTSLSLTSTTDATSPTVGGSFTTLGGAGIAKKLFVGNDVSLATLSGSVTIGSLTPVTVSASGVLRIDNETDSSSSTSGSLIVDGGAGIAKKLFVGADVSLATVSGIVTLGSTTPVTIAADGVLRVDNNTPSTSTTTGSVIIDGGLGVAGAVYADSGNFVTLSAPHSGLSGLSADDHTQYVLLAGRSTGQTIIGGTGAGEHLVLVSTSNVTKGNVIVFDTTDSSSTSTGALIVNGGVGIAKKLYIGTDLNVAGITSLGASNTVTVSAAGAVTIPTNLTLSALTASKPVSTNASNVLITSPTTGTGSTVVLDTSPTLVTPVLGVASGTSLNLSGALTVNGISTLGASNSVTISAAGVVNIPGLTASQAVFTDSSKNLVSVATTGSGNVVLATSPTLVTPVLGVASGTSLNLSGALTVNGISTLGATTSMTVSASGAVSIASTLSVSGITSLGATNTVTVSAAGAVTIPTNLTLSALTASKPVSTNASNVLITSPTTGTGSTVVLDTSPTLVTPVLGVASGTSLNLSGALTVNGISTLGATTSMTVSASGAVSIASTLSVSGITSLGSTNTVTVSAAGAVTIPTNLTLSALTASKPVSTNASNVLITSPTTGTGSTVVLDTSPTLVTPVLGVASGTSLSLTSSTASTSATLGALTLVGGIGINNATDAVSATNGGTITTAGGAGIAKKLFVGTDTALATVSGSVTIGSTTAATISAAGILTINNATNATSATSAALVVTGGIGTSGSVFIGTKNITPNTGDITAQVTFTGAQSASAANVTGLSFNPASTRSFEVLMSVVIVATSSLYAQFKLQGIYNGTSWYFAPTYLGDNTLVTFAITNAGQVTYSSSTYTGFSSLTMKFKAVSLNI